MRQSVVDYAPGARRAILLAVVAGVPVLFLRSTLDPFNVPKLGLLMLGILSVLAVRIVELLQGGEPFRFDRSFLIFSGAFALTIFTSWLVSPHKGWALLGEYGRFQGLVPYLLTVLLGILIADSFAGDVRSLMWALLGSGATVGAYAFIQFIGLDPLQWAFGSTETTQSLSTLGNPNFTGGFLGIVLPVGAALFFREEALRTRVLGLSVLVVLGWAVARSEAGFAAGLAGMLIVAGYAYAERWRWARLGGLLAAAVVALGVVGAVTLSVVRSDSAQVPPTTATLRAGWWVASIRMIEEAPLFGNGPDAFSLEGVTHRTLDDALTQRFEYTDDPHSVPLSIASASGIFGLVAFLGLIAWAVWRGQGLSPRDDLLAVGCLAAAAAYFTQATVSIDQVSLRTALWAAVGGLSASVLQTSKGMEKKRAPRSTKGKAGRRIPDRRKREPLRNIPGVAIASALFILGSWWVASFLVADARMSLASQQFQLGKVDEGLSSYKAAVSFRSDPMYARTAGFYIGRSIIAGAKPRAELLSEMHRAYASFLGEMPDPGGARDLARLLVEQGNPERATEWYQLALRLDPLNPQLRQEAAEANLVAEELEGAIQVLEGYLTEHRAKLETAATKGLDYMYLWNLLATAELRAGEISKGLDVSRYLMTVGAYSQAEEALRLFLDQVMQPDAEQMAPVWGTLALVRAEGQMDPGGVRDAAERALDIDPGQPEAREALALVQ